MKGDEKEKKDKGIYKRMGGNSAKLTPKRIVLEFQKIYISLFGGSKNYEEVFKTVSTSCNRANGIYCSIRCNKIC